MERLDLIDDYKFRVHPRIAGHGPTLYEGGPPGMRRHVLISAEPLRNGAVAMSGERGRSTCFDMCSTSDRCRPANVMRV
ncbi:MAG: hypothetical protein JWQ73_568 [Variovorax sp.]|jgi:hypothetical protein|nr:hypothetical protein [Variovorax sp.]